MKQGRIPAQNVENLRGASNKLSSDISVSGAIKPHNDGLCQLPWANYCSHIPNDPQFFTPPKDKKNRSKAIQQCLKSVEQSYFDPRHLLNSLQLDSDSGSLVKSQRRNAALVLLQVMFYYVDDATGRIGRRSDNGSWQDLTIAKLAQYAGLRFKRAKRAMKIIVKAGYLHVTKQYKRLTDGTYLGLPSIREFTPKLFAELDVKGTLWKAWWSLKEYKKARQAKAETKQDKKAARASIAFIQESLKGVGRKVKKGMNKINGMVNRVTGEKAVSDARVHHIQKIGKASVELNQCDPSKTASEYYAELLKKYPPPQ